MSIISQLSKLNTMCAVCKESTRRGQALCTYCTSLLKPLAHTCRVCAYPLSNTQQKTCGNCIKHPPYFNKVKAPFLYEEPLRSLLHAYKYQQQYYLSLFFAKKMVANLSAEDKYDIVIPVPMHFYRQLQRGFNQALCLAYDISKLLSIPLNTNMVTKLNHTKPQATLNLAQRNKNIKNSFSCAKLAANHILLIDDLITTGNTVNEIARVLKQLGAIKVDVWSIARAYL